MTHINQINESILPQSLTSKPGSKKNSTQSFEALLNKAVGQSPGDTDMENSAVSGLGEISSAGPILADSSKIVSGKTDALLSMMASYSSKLGNPQISLKSMASVLENINRDAAALLEEAQHLTAKDDLLKQVATQTAVTAQTEYMKFQRGDYLS